MRTFFSGTDRNTLLKEGADCNNFLSLIVNNEGTYTAAITRRVELENSVSKKVTTTGKYPLFNTGVEVLMPRQEDKSSYKETVISVEFLYLTVEKNDNIEASPECEAFNKVTTIPYFQKYASSSTGAVNSWYNKNKSYSTTPYQPYKPFEETPKSGKGNYYGSLFEEYGLKEQEEHIPESFKGLTDEEEDILKTECSKINWNDSFYLLFMEKLFFGSPFIVKAHCSDFKSEVDYIAKNFDAVCKRTFSVLDMKTWFESSADFYVYETDFPTIDDEPDFAVYFDAFAPTVYRIIQAFEPYRGKSEYIDMACKILSAKL